jgi:lipopolysaccharide export system protein LptC
MTTLEADRTGYMSGTSRAGAAARAASWLARVLLPAAIAPCWRRSAAGGWRSFTAATAAGREQDPDPHDHAALLRSVQRRAPFIITARSAVRDDNDLKRVFLDAPTLTLGVGSPAPTR